MNDYTLLIGDITRPQISTSDQTQTILIPHVVNDVGAFGAGVALAIRKRWPKAEKDYQKWFQFWKHTPGGCLGHTGSSVVEGNNKYIIVIVHMFAQKGLRGQNNDHPLSCEHLKRCMGEVVGIGEALHEPFTIHCPKFGSGLGGGNWSEIETLIRTVWCTKNIPVSVYSYRKAHDRTKQEE